MNTPESTLFNAVPVVSELNRVAGFDPLRFLKKTANGHELELRYKKLWFRLKYPAGRTRLTPLRITDQLAIIEAKVLFDKDDADPASSYIATMTQENAPAGLYIQAAEHDALDMALTNAGFGIQFAPMPKADTPYAEPTTPVMRSEPAPAPQAAAEQVRTEPAAVRADIEPVVVQQPEQEVVHHAEKAVPDTAPVEVSAEQPAEAVVEPAVETELPFVYDEPSAASYTKDMDVAELLHLHIRRRQADSVYADCPICGDKRGKMNINFAKNLWRCNYCNEGGGMLSLYGKVYGISNSEAYREICDTLQNGLTAPEYTVKELPEQAAIEQSVLASPQEIHQTFSMLLELLTLTPQHRKHLHEVRGLTDEQIERLGYKSTPPFYLCRSLAQKLRSRGCKVEGVPGFYVGKDDKWTVNFNSVTAGIIIPAKGIDGMIRGAQIRLDTPIRDQESDPDKSGTKYLWLSSASKKRGVSYGSPVRFVGDPFARVVYVTEGLLKADVAHFLMDRSFAATAGANNVNKLDMLFALLSANGTEVIIEAEDMDKYHNAAVSKGASKIYLMARSHGLECRRLMWDPNYKGIDDWQLAMRQKKEQRDVSQMNFRTRFVCGFCSFDAISEEIAAWHERNTGSSTLREHLGLSEQEYARFLRDGDAALEQYLLSLRAQQCFRIYQPDVSEGKAADFAFGGIRALQKAGYEQPPASEYALVYEGTLVCEVQQDDAIRLKLVAARYSGELPADYHGRSVSPSTVIEFFDENGRRYFYCDGNDKFLPVKFSPKLAKDKRERH